MLEKPDLPDQRIITCLRDDYGLQVAELAFLPLGADQNTAVYRAIATDARPYFVKLRRGVFDEIAVTLPRFLSDRGLQQAIAPLSARTGQLWASLGAFTVILYPFVKGRNGYEQNFSAQHWHDLGAALKCLHTTTPPPALLERILQETYSPQWRVSLRMSLERAVEDDFTDPVAVRLAAVLQARRDEIMDLIGRAERLAQTLQAHPPKFVVCHADVHAGNVLIDDRGALYIVDWDAPILAPKERDLMFAGGGQGFRGHAVAEEEALFYQGYGETRVDPIALAFYRYERIIEDLAIFSEQILLTHEGGDDRGQALRYLLSNFQPGNTIEIACRSDRTRVGSQGCV